MPRPGVTRDQVFAAADQLAQEGTHPTAKLVRDRTGGSFSTITPHLAAWKDERGGRGVANIPDMPESVANATWAVWAAAWNAAREAVKTERDGLTAARREMEKERAEMAAEIVELETKLDAIQGERDSLGATLEAETKRHHEAEEKIGDLKIENARLEERIANTDKRADELRDQVTRLEGELARLAQTKGEAKEEPPKASAPKPKPSPKKPT
jgi:septal ring factor EnvC (AmiA/AmiB activator)